MDNYLTGSGHFAIGFCIGFIVMLILLRQYKESINIQIYSPFIPFLFGIYSSIPYLFITESSSNIPWLNLFLFFHYLHHNPLVIKVFGQMYLVVVLCGAMYGYIILRYIRLVKYCRRYGWSYGVNNA